MFCTHTVLSDQETSRQETVLIVSLCMAGTLQMQQPITVTTNSVNSMCWGEKTSIHNPCILFMGRESNRHFLLGPDSRSVIPSTDTQDNTTGMIYHLRIVMYLNDDDPCMPKKLALHAFNLHGCATLPLLLNSLVNI